jgi:acetamidase/formamidase
MTTATPTSTLHIPSTPDTVVRGYLTVEKPPVARVEPGQVVTIDTVSAAGLRLDGPDPIAFFGAHGIAAEEVLQDAIDIYHHVRPPEGRPAGHVLTGPIAIAGARPGDVLEVRILAVTPRVPYGVNTGGPGFGALPHLLGETVAKVIRLDLERNVARFSAEIEIPLKPFMGVMAVAPPPSMGFVSSRPPGVYGGNMDLNELGAGATLYLPVHKADARFIVGDGHAVQGDGEVTGTAIEISQTVTLQFLLHPQRPLVWPRAETATHHITMGMDEDLNLAMSIALQEAVNFLQQEKGLSAADAYSLCSLAVDFEVAEAVNHVKMVHGMIPKSIFKTATPYWA